MTTTTVFWLLLLGDKILLLVKSIQLWDISWIFPHFNIRNRCITTVEYLFVPCPPPKLETKFTIGRWPFLGSTFLCFFEKNVTFLNLHCYIMFFQNCSKSRFTTWNPILCHFLTKTKVVPLGFFQILIKIHDFWIYHTTSCFIRIVQKVNFTTWNPILCHFFCKEQGSTLSFFFQILTKIRDFCIYYTTSCFIRIVQKVNFTA